MRLPYSVVAALVVAFPSAGTAQNNLWTSEGYGYFFDASPDTLHAFEVTTISCIPSFIAVAVPAPTGAVAAYRFVGAPVTVLMLLLSARSGALAQRIGARIPLSVGPVVIAAGLLLMTGIDPGDSYVSSVLPAVIVFGLGLTLVVAPVTATVLAAADARHSGIASGINNGVSRVAGLLAIAILGALIAGKFTSTIDSNLAGKQLSPQAERSVSDAKDKPGARDEVEQLKAQALARAEAAGHSTCVRREGRHSMTHLSSGLGIWPLTLAGQPEGAKSSQ